MLTDHGTLILISSIFLTYSCAISIALLARLATILSRPRPKPTQVVQPPNNDTDINLTRKSTHLLVVLGSGGHTAEMLNMLSSIPDVVQKFDHRTYVVSSGDDFSAQKAHEFERGLIGSSSLKLQQSTEKSQVCYSVVTVRRARYVHQSFFTTPFTALVSLWDCVRILRGRGKSVGTSRVLSPDLILTNGPGTGVCIVLASIMLLFVGQCRQDQMRTVFIESWARVKTLSLSGKILRSMVSRVLVQWPQLAGDGLEYMGPLVS